MVPIFRGPAPFDVVLQGGQKDAASEAQATEVWAEKPGSLALLILAPLALLALCTFFICFLWRRKQKKKHQISPAPPFSAAAQGAPDPQINA